MKTIYTSNVITAANGETRQFTVRVFRGKYEVLVQRNATAELETQFASKDFDYVMRNVNQMISNLEAAKAVA